MNICAFCGPTKEPMSPEDVWPRWLSKYFRENFKTRQFGQVVTHLKSGLVNSGTGQRAKMEAPVVCRKCNNEWMSAIEILAKGILAPLLDNPKRPRPINDADAITLAAWMMVKGVVLDHYMLLGHGQTKPFFSPQQRSVIRTMNVPPSRNVWVWMGRRQMLRSPISGDFQTLYYSKFAAKTQKDLRAFVFTLAVNEVVMQLVAFKSATRKPLLLQYIPYAWRPSIGVWSDYLYEVWPSRLRAIAWPPPRQLGRDGFNFLAYRLGGIPPPSL